MAASRHQFTPDRLARTRETRGRVCLSAAAVLGAGAGAALLSGDVSVLVACGVGAAWSGERAGVWFEGASRARIGARSETMVIDALAHLRARGWEFHYNVALPGNGDIDVVGIAPGRAPRLMVVIETKTSRYTRRNLTRTLRAARTLAGDGPSAAILVTITRRETAVRHGVTICSVDRVAGVLSALQRTPSVRLASEVGSLGARPARSAVEQLALGSQRDSAQGEPGWVDDVAA
jgi:hypothetical protein